MPIYLVITPFFPDANGMGGAYVFDQVQALMKLSGMRVVVMKPDTMLHTPVDYTVHGVKVHRFRNFTLPSNIAPNRLSDKLSEMAMFNKLKALNINVEDIAVCHTHVTSLGHFALAVKRRNPQAISIVQHHGFDVMSVTDGRLAKYKWHENLCVRYGVKICNAMDVNVGVSRRTLQYVKDCPGVNLKREYVLYNGVDTSVFHGPRLGTPGKFVIGCVANFWELKDQMTLLRAAKRLVDDGMTDLLVKLVGTGYMRETCVNFVRDNNLGDCVTFLTEVPHAQLLDFYRSLDLFVLPSYWEAFGCVYTEAYACGVPFVGVKNQGIAELFTPEEGEKWLIEKGDDKKLAEIVKRERVAPENEVLKEDWEIEKLVKKFLENLKNK